MGYVDVVAFVWVREHVAGVVDYRQPQADVPCLAVHAVEQFGPLYSAAPHIVKCCRRSGIQVVGELAQQDDPGLCLPSSHLALVAVIVAVGKSHSPEVRGEGVEECGVRQAVFVVGEDVGTTYSKHVEANR